MKTRGGASEQGLSEIESKLYLLESNMKDEIEDDALLDEPTGEETVTKGNWQAPPVASVLAEEGIATNNSKVENEMNELVDDWPSLVIEVDLTEEKHNHITEDEQTVGNIIITEAVLLNEQSTLFKYFWKEVYGPYENRRCICKHECTGM